MTEEGNQLKTILVTATALNGDVLALVTYADGSCGITRAGKPIASTIATPCDLREITEVILKLAHLD